MFSHCSAVLPEPNGFTEGCQVPHNHGCWGVITTPAIVWFNLLPIVGCQVVNVCFSEHAWLCYWDTTSHAPIPTGTWFQFRYELWRGLSYRDQKSPFLFLGAFLSSGEVELLPLLVGLGKITC